ncbi:MAG TPA: hypothetical protein VKU61_08040 [Candidatus Binatia bacterium]|nr:hypothetical protein [Candidatus Binatia bacterium]
MGRITKFLPALVAFAVAALLAGDASSARADAACFHDARANFASCVSQCRSDFVAAKLTCRNVDPACGAACLAGRAQCRDNVDEILQTGQVPGGGTLANCSGGTDQCKATLQAAKQACGAPCQASDTQCNECVDNAQVAAFECRDACRDSWRTNPTVIAMLASCQSAFRACIANCPPAPTVP